jgi:hypothetical protein
MKRFIHLLDAAFLISDNQVLMSFHFRVRDQLEYRGGYTRIFLYMVIFAFLFYGLWIVYNKNKIFPLCDFIQYWSSARLNSTGGDPYNLDQMLIIERSVGWDEDEALMIFNPPIIFSITTLFGAINYPFSRFLWFVSQIFIIFFCSLLLWKIYKGNKKNEWIAWIALLAFGPMLQALKVGQVTILVLLGSVVFLYLINLKYDFWAGFFVSLVFLKPHLLYLFIIAIFFWSIFHHRYMILIGLFTALTILISIAWLINPQVISQYIYAMRFNPPENWIPATVGSLLRLYLGPEKFYLQFIPFVIGIVWFIFYWARNYKKFNWDAHLPLIALISLATSPYGWTFDSLIAALAVIHIATLFDFSVWNIPKLLIFSTFWCVSLLIAFVSLPQLWFWWLPYFFLIWYIISYYYLSNNRKPLNQPSIIYSS